MFGQNDTNVSGASINGALSGPEPDVNEANNVAPSAPAVNDQVASDTIGFGSSPVVAPSATNPAASATASDDDLLSIKQKALEHLSPLVKHLDQTPADKFKTTMMMIQASDDQSLIPEAYEAANSITDEKEKAQALLDIVNEINYFTQKS